MEKYELIVRKYRDIGTDDETFDEVFILGGPREVVARGVGMAAEVLGASSATVTMDNTNATFTPLPSAPVNAVQVASPQMLANAEASAEAERPKRTRRTKAQIEADKQAEAEQAAVEAQQASIAANDALQQHANSQAQGGMPAAWQAPVPSAVAVPDGAQVFPGPAAFGSSLPATTQVDGQVTTNAPAYSPFGPPQS